MNYNLLTEKELIALCIQGDGGAFQVLIMEHQAKLKSAMYSAFNHLSIEDHEDCWQNAITKAFLNLKNFREASSFKTWMYVIFRNEILLFLRQKQTVSKHELHIEDIPKNSESEANNSYDLVMNIDDRLTETAASIIEKQEEVSYYSDLISKALEKLQPNHSEVLKMVLVDEMSYKEVSDILKIPIGTVMSRLYFARKNMQKIIKQYAKTDDTQLPHFR